MVLIGLLQWALMLGPPVVPFYPFSGEASLTKIDYTNSLTKVDYTKKGTLILTSLLEDLEWSL